MAKKNKFRLIKITVITILFAVTSHIVYNQFFISDCKKVSRIEKEMINDQKQHSNNLDEIVLNFRTFGVDNEKINIAVGHSLIIDENDEEMKRVAMEDERLSTNLNDLNNTELEDNCEKKLKILEKLKLIKNQQYDLIQKSLNDELSLALKYQAAPKDLLEIFNVVKDTQNIKYATPITIGLLLNKLLIYKLDPDLPDYFKLDIEDSAFLMLENGVQETSDYYFILKNMLAIDKNGCMCLEIYKDENGTVLTRNIEKNPNYILDNEKKIREWLLGSSKNQDRLNALLTKKNIRNQNDWYVNEN